MSFDFQRVLESKTDFRRKLAQKPIGEKLHMLEELAERALALRRDTSSPISTAPWAIPDHWRWSTMGEVASVVGGSTPKTDRLEYFGGDIPWITPADLSKYTAKKISRGVRNITQTGLDNSGARLLPANTVLFSCRAPIGCVAIAANPVATNQGFKSFVLGDKVTPDFVYYYLQRAKPLAVSLASGTTFLEISGKNAARLPIPVPPLDEQQRIVAEIEKQFTRWEAGVASLKRVQAALKRYRASVLKAACEGRLVPTEAELARRESRPYEPATTLLACILEERRSHWFGRGRYEEPATLDTTKLYQLPDGWTWAAVEQLITQPLCNGISIKGSDSPPGVRALRLSAMSNSGFDYSEARFLPLADADVDDLWIQPGDFFMSRGNGSLHLVGRGTSAQQPSEPTIFPDTMIRLRWAKPVQSTRWVQTLWPSRIVRAQIESKVKTTAGIYKIAQPQVEQITIPLPPLAEQHRIVAEVDRRLSVIEELEAVVAANLQRATRLRQAILHRAFSGQLSG